MIRRSRWRTTVNVSIALVALTDSAQAQIVKLQDPIPFYGARLTAFETGAILKGASRTWRPSRPEYMFVTIKLELQSPLEYVRGRFREITLADEAGGVYRYRGWLTEEGWLQIDDGDTSAAEPLGRMEADEYPAYIDLHFEVPESAHSLVLRYRDAAATLF